MSSFWKGLRGLVKKDHKSTTDNYNVFAQEMTLKLVFVGGHKAGKTSMIRILKKRKFKTAYDPTIGIDCHKIRMENSTNKEWLWLWDISHAELGSVHESLIFHQTHGIILVVDLTNFISIQAIDQWLHSISIHIKLMTEQQQLQSRTINEQNISDDHSSQNSSQIGSQISSNISSINEDYADDDQKYPTNIKNTHPSFQKNRRNKKSKKKNNDLWLPRLYLLITKYDLSDEPILTDTQLHKFCKSNCIRAFARISSKLDKRSDMMDILGKFSQDIIRHMPKQKTFHILQEQNDRLRYNHAIRRLQRRKIHSNQRKNNACDAIFDLRVHSVKEFQWGMHSTIKEMKEEEMISLDDRKHIKIIHDDESDGSEDDLSNISPAEKQLFACEEKAKLVLISMKEAIHIQRNRTLKDIKLYNIHLKKYPSMNESKDEENESGNGGESEQLIFSLKMQILKDLEQEIENLTISWEIELNTIAELIRFQMPLIRTSANLNILHQQIIARKLLFQRRLRLVHTLQSPTFDSVEDLNVMENNLQLKDGQNVVKTKVDGKRNKITVKMLSSVGNKKLSTINGLISENTIASLVGFGGNKNIK